MINKWLERIVVTLCDLVVALSVYLATPGFHPIKNSFVAVPLSSSPEELLAKTDFIIEGTPVGRKRTVSDGPVAFEVTCVKVADMFRGKSKLNEIEIVQTRGL